MSELSKLKYIPPDQFKKYFVLVAFSMFYSKLISGYNFKCFIN